MHRLMNYFERMRLNTKLLLGFGFVLIITLLIGGLSLYDMAKLNKVSQRLYEEDTLGVSHIKEANTNLIYIGRSLRQMVVAPDPAQRESAKQRLELARTTLQKELEEGRKRIFRKEVITLIEEFDQFYAQYLRNVDHVIKVLNTIHSLSFTCLYHRFTHRHAWCN